MKCLLSNISYNVWILLLLKAYSSNYISGVFGHTSGFSGKFELDQTCSNWIKPVPIGSNMSKSDQWCSIRVLKSYFLSSNFRFYQILKMVHLGFAEIGGNLHLYVFPRISLVTSCFPICH